MQAIHQAIQDGRLKATIAAIVSDNPKAAGLEYARSHGLPIQIVEKNPAESREEFNLKLLKELQGHQPDLIALAGYMRILSKHLIEAFPNQIVNIHPSLLPAFPGLHAQRQALEAGVRYSGCTVHFVDTGCDTGPIIDQRVVEVKPGDDEESLSDRILKEEHQLYWSCVQKIAEGKVRMEGCRVLLK